MPETSRHDAWQAGDSYDAYMGRWSRQIVLRFLDWLHAPDGLDWLEVGCGTGALSAAILAQCDPKSLIAIDQSEGFIRKARAKVPDTRAEFRVGDAQGLPAETASRDVIASALVLNFVPDRQKALSEMKRVARAGAKMGLYVWDYPGGGIEFIRAFWRAATALDPNALDLTEDKRFPYWTHKGPDQSGRRSWSRVGGLHGDRGRDRVQGFRGLLAPVHVGCRPCARLLHEPQPQGAAAATGEAARRPSSARGRLNPARSESMGDQSGGRVTPRQCLLVTPAMRAPTRRQRSGRSAPEHDASSEGTRQGSGREYRRGSAALSCEPRRR
jgi:SAM-dependent methyltransferase